MIPFDLTQGVAGCRQEVFIGIDHVRIEVELNHGHGPVCGFDQILIALIGEVQLGHVAGNFNELSHLTLGIADRGVGCRNPDLGTVGAATSENAIGRFA